MEINLKRDRMAGLRFAYLIRRLMDDGWSGPKIAAAIGCDPSLVSKWKWRGGTAPYDFTRKGIRDDVVQGIYDGLGVRADYLFMPTPKGYSQRVRLKGGDSRPCEKYELDHKDFVVVTNAEFEAARDRKERQQLRDDQTETKRQLDALSGQVQLILTALGNFLPERTTK